MKKGLVEVIFWLFGIIIALMIAYGFFSSFSEASPAGLQAQKDLQQTIELVCADEGPSESGVVLFLPKTDTITGNSQFQKLHLATDGSLEFHKCSNTGPSCTSAAQKTVALNCPPNTKFSDCWIAPSSTEDVSADVIKAFGVIKFNMSESVSCS
jgi:hypothetical protein